MEWESLLSPCAWVKFIMVVVTVHVLLGFVSQMLRGRPPKRCEGFTARGWNRVAEVFKKHVKSGHHRAGGFAVYHKGQLVVELVGGYADYESEWPWDKTTLSCLHECTRGIGATVIAILVDRGLLDYSSPVANYWPQFAANGKESITVEQLLSHQAGLIVLDEVYSFFDIIKKPNKMSHLLATARPIWKPGSRHGIHDTTIGLYMDQLVRKVDPYHRSLQRFFAEEVSRKFGIDCFIGLPKEENYRCAPFQWPFALSALLDFLMMPKYWVFLKMFIPGCTMMKMWFNNSDFEKHLQNNPAFRKIPCASMHGYATAAGLAKLYGILANGSRHANQTPLSPSAVQKLNEPLAGGFDCVYFLNTTFGRGTTIMKSQDGHNIFGHPGFCGQGGFADPKHRLGWAYISNYPSICCLADDWKYRQLIETMYETVRELEQREHTD